MSDSGGIPELQTSKPDGSLKTRIEMDEWLRKEVPKVHWLRIHASRTYGLPKQISFDMKEILLRHWILDEMVRRGLIIGDQLGVNTTNYNDESENRQFTQRLFSAIQSGYAVQPQHAEGIDMNGYTPPPPPVMGPPGAPAPGPSYPAGPPPQQYQQPGPPQMAGGYPAGPPQPPGPPPQQYAAPQGPPVGPPGYAPPPAGVPVAPQQMAGPAMGPPVGPQTNGRRGKRADAAPSAPMPATPVPPPGAPQGFAPAGYTQAPQGFAPPMPQQAQAPQQQEASVDVDVDLTPVLQKIDQLSGIVNQLVGIVNQQAQSNAAMQKKVEMLSMVCTLIGRAYYQKQGSVDAAGFLTEVGVPLPQ